MINEFAHIIEELASRHKSVRHSKKDIHFANNVQAAQNAFAVKMHYPAVIVDQGDFVVSKDGDAYSKNRVVTMLFVQHVKDAGSFKEIDTAFEEMEELCDQFIYKLHELAHTNLSKYRCLRRLSLDGAEAERIYLESAALFGWGITFRNKDIACANKDVWEDVEDEYCCN